MIHLHPTTLIAVPVPEDAHGFFKENLDIWQLVFDRMPQNGYYDWIDIGFNFSIIGTVTKDTIGFDTETHMPNYIKGCDDYVDFEDNMNCYNDADNSFRSLLSANEAYFENPYREKPQEPKKKTMGRVANYLTKRSQWQTAQSKVNKKYVILQKI